MQEERKNGQYEFDDLEASPIVYKSPLTAPLFLCFNWNDVFERQGFTERTDFYVVAFRSVRRRDADVEALKSTNDTALEESRKSGGLIKYFQGRPNSQRHCFETSIWESKAAAEQAARRPAYTEAMRLAANMYESYTLERYSMTATVDNLPAFQLIDRTSSS